ERAAYEVGGVVERDVFVVPSGGLGGRRENRFRKFVGLTKARRQRNAANFSGGGVFLPARAAEITAYHALGGKRICLADQHCAAGELLAIGVKGSGKVVCAQDVIGNDIPEQIKPEHRNLCEDFSLVGNRRRHDHVKRREPVGRDDKQLIAEVVNV